MQFWLFDDAQRDEFLPLAFTRPLCDLRFGITTIREKWQQVLDSSCQSLTQDYLQEVFEISDEEHLLINGRFAPSEALTQAIDSLNISQGIVLNETLIACKLNKEALKDFIDEKELSFDPITSDNNFTELASLYDLFGKLPDRIKEDFSALTSQKKSNPIPKWVTVIGPSEDIFISEGAKVLPCILNTTDGPIFIGENAEIMEGSMVRGPFSLGQNATLKLGTKIYGATSIGPHSKVGGEVSNSLIQGYSNKGHDGFMGNSILGEWCNLGADTNTSNLKNNYSEVKTWKYGSKSFENSDKIFCGLVMGDHSKCSINSMFNTGTVCGVMANVFGSGFPPKFIPSFSWGGSAGFQEYDLNKGIEVARKVMKRRSIDLSVQDDRILRQIFKITSEFRHQ